MAYRFSGVEIGFVYGVGSGCWGAGVSGTGERGMGFG